MILNKKYKFIFFGAFSLGLFLTKSVTSVASVVYTGGPFYKNMDTSIAELKSSGFQTIIIWTIHIEPNGDMGFNGEFPLVQNGVYIGAQTYPNFATNVASLKEGVTSVNRVEFGLSGSGSGTFNAVKNFFTADGGFGENTTLYRNFQALRQAIPSVDAINNNDEVTYDLESTVSFMQMLATLGYQNTIVPFRRASHWRSVASRVTLSHNYLQVYGGGSINNPCSDVWNFGPPVIPGSSNRVSTPMQVQARMSQWNATCGINSGFMWLYDNFQGAAAGYAKAISDGVAGSITPTNDGVGDGTTPIVGDQ